MLQGRDAIDAALKINLVDSRLLGIGVDIFKVQVLLDADSSLISTLFSEGVDARLLKLEFVGPQELSLELNMQYFSEPYIDNELAAADLGGFRFETIDITELSIHGIAVNYKTLIASEKCTISFRFAELIMSLFDPLDLDPAR